MVSFLKKLFGGKAQVAPPSIEQAKTAAGSAAADKVSNMRDLASSAMGGGIPDVAELQNAIGKLPEGELSSVVSGALQGLPAEARTQLGGLLSKASREGGSSAGIASGDAGALGSALSGVLKSEGGLGNLAGLFGGGSGAAGGGAGGFAGAVGDIAGGSGGGLDLAGLMSNPLAKTILAAIVPAILKAVQGK